MAFASYDNNRAERENLPMVLGCFDNEYGYLYEYTARAEDDTWAAEFPHRVFVGNNETRIARVLKTRMHIVVDEDENGNPVTETWEIRRKRVYDV